MTRISDLNRAQRAFFGAGQTRPLAFRRAELERLRGALREYEPLLLAALREDLGKAEFEGYAAELGMLYGEIDEALRHLKKWARPGGRAPPSASFPPEGGSMWNPWAWFSFCRLESIRYCSAWPLWWGRLRRAAAPASSPRARRPLRHRPLGICWAGPSRRNTWRLLRGTRERTRRFWRSGGITSFLRVARGRGERLWRRRPAT